MVNLATGWPSGDFLAGSLAPSTPAPTTAAEPEPASEPPAEAPTFEAIVTESVRRQFNLIEQPAETPEGDPELDALLADEEAEDGGLFPDPRADDSTAALDIVLDPTWAAPVAKTAFYGSVGVDCIERMATLARNGFFRPLADKAASEARIVQQLDAIVCAAPDSLSAMVEWHSDTRSEWGSWALAFTLGSIAGREPLQALAVLLEQLDDACAPHARRAAAAFAATANPHFIPLARALVSSSHHTARAAGIELLSHHGAISPSDLSAWIERGDSMTRCVAMRSLLRNPEVLHPPDCLPALLSSDDTEVCWHAAHCLSVLGRADAYDALRRDVLLAQSLGVRALEVFVMKGEPADIAILQRLVNTLPASKASLSAIGRFGHPTVWSYLCHHLADPIHQDDAVEALLTLFGPCVAPEQRTVAAAWEKAVGELRLLPQVRYRRGQPWSPALVANECTSGELSCFEIAARVDELRARTGITSCPNVSRWSNRLAAELASMAAEATERSRHYQAGAWVWR